MKKLFALLMAAMMLPGVVAPAATDIARQST